MWIDRNSAFGHWVTHPRFAWTLRNIAGLSTNANPQTQILQKLEGDSDLDLLFCNKLPNKLVGQQCPLTHEDSRSAKSKFRPFTILSSWCPWGLRACFAQIKIAPSRCVFQRTTNVGMNLQTNQCVHARASVTFDWVRAKVLKYGTDRHKYLV